MRIRASHLRRCVSVKERTETVLLVFGKYFATLKNPGPSSTIRVPLFAARTLNATGQYRVTLSLR